MAMARSWSLQAVADVDRGHIVRIARKPHLIAAELGFPTQPSRAHLDNEVLRRHRREMREADDAAPAIKEFEITDETRQQRSTVTAT